MSVLTLAGHQVPTSLAKLEERQWRLNHWMTRYIMGCGDCPCEICSVPEPNQVYTLQYDADGHITDETLDLSCVPPLDCTQTTLEFPSSSCGHRVVTINNEVRNCELTGCRGVSVSENKKVYLTHCDADNENYSNLPVKVYLTNNGVPVTKDEFGNPVPEFYLLGVGQLKFVCVVNGRITRIVN
jgi:hypothetical protein